MPTKLQLENRQLLNRAGATIIEILIVVGIIALLLGLLLPAVQKVRESGNRAICMNNLKQCSLGMHNLSNMHNDRIPGIISFEYLYTSETRSVHFQLLPFLERPIKLQIDPITRQEIIPVVSTYICPSDSSDRKLVSPIVGAANYVINARIIEGITFSIMNLPDGNANTILFTEQYRHSAFDNLSIQWHIDSIACKNSGMNGDPNTFVTSSRRATFADRACQDIQPSTTGNPPRTFSSDRPTSFRTMPSHDKAYSRVPQSPHSSGIHCGMADGSVRLFTPNTSEEIWWSAVTPAGGETVGLE